MHYGSTTSNSYRKELPDSALAHRARASRELRCLACIFSSLNQPSHLPLFEIMFTLSRIHCRCVPVSAALATQGVVAGPVLRSPLVSVLRARSLSSRRYSEYPISKPFVSWTSNGKGRQVRLTYGLSFSCNSTASN